VPIVEVVCCPCGIAFEPLSSSDPDERLCDECNDNLRYTRWRFLVKVENGDKEACWPWLGYRSDGYGKFGLSNGKTMMAHRYAYELWIGPIPHEHDLDQLLGEPT
jgi:hypothetical protein